MFLTTWITIANIMSMLATKKYIKENHELNAAK